ncbi:MAG: hypothetical protein ACJ738_14845 [Gaiellales bacterium]
MAVMLLATSSSASASGVIWTTHGPEGADIAAFASDPISGVVYAGGDQTVWSSSDGGAHWAKAGTTHAEVGWLAADPAGGVLYATNNYQTCPFERSVDGGASWTRVCTGIEGGGAVAIDTTSGDLYAIFSGSTFTSTDDGQSWTATGGGPASARTIAVVHGSPDQVYVGSGDGHVWRSDDGGVSFQDMGAVTATAASALISAPDGIYAVSNFDGTVFRSTDEGQTWNETAANLGVLGLVAAPTPGTLYLIGMGHDYATTDGGAHWSTADAGLYRNGSGVPNGIWVDPSDPSHLLATTGTDVYRSTDAAASWSFSSAGLSDGQEVRALAADAAGPGTLYAGTKSGGVFVSSDEGDSWSPAGPGITGSIFAITADPSTPGTVYASNGGHLFRSTDGAASWSQIDSGFAAGRIWAIAVDPADPLRIYAVDGTTIERSVDGGATWAAAAASPVQASGDIADILVDASDPSRLYAGGFRVWISTDHGDTWSSPMAANLPGGDFVQSLAQDPAHPQHLLAAGYDHLYQSTDSGATWTVLPGFESGSAAAFDPGGDGAMYVANGSGVDVSPDGSVWGPIAGSFSAARSGTGLVFDGSRLIVGASTGVAAADLVAPAAVTLAPSGVGSRNATIRASINPVGQSTTVTFQYGTTPGYGQTTFPVTAGDGNDDVTVTDLVSGLVPATTYHYRAVVTGDGGVAVGADQVFTTFGDQPDVVTGAADSIDTTDAVLHGSVNPNGLATTAYYDLGTSPTALVQESLGPVGSGTAALPQSIPVWGLQPDTTYYYRLEARNIQDRTLGDIETFRTAPAPPQMVGYPTVDLTPHQQVETWQLLLHLTWASQAGSHAVCSHIVRDDENGAGFTTLPLGTLPGTSADVGISPGQSDQFSVAAVGCDGTQSGWAGATTVHTVLLARPRVAYAGGWRTQRNSHDLGGSMLVATSATARAALTTNGYEAGWLSTTGPRYGRALVSADGGRTWTTVNLHSPARHHGELVYQHRWKSPGKHTILIKALATRGRPLLGIDGVVALHWVV